MVSPYLIVLLKQCFQEFPWKLEQNPDWGKVTIDRSTPVTCGYMFIPNNVFSICLKQSVFLFIFLSSFHSVCFSLSSLSSVCVLIPCYVFFPLFHIICASVFSIQPVFRIFHTVSCSVYSRVSHDHCNTIYANVIGSAIFTGKLTHALLLCKAIGTVSSRLNQQSNCGSERENAKQ